MRRMPSTKKKVKAKPPNRKVPLLVKQFPKQVADAIKKAGDSEMLQIDRRLAFETAKYLHELLKLWASGGLKSRGKSGRPRVHVDADVTMTPKALNRERVRKFRENKRKAEGSK